MTRDYHQCGACLLGGLIAVAFWVAFLAAVRWLMRIVDRGRPADNTGGES